MSNTTARKLYNGRVSELSRDVTPGRNPSKEFTFKGIYEMVHFRNGMKPLRTKLRVLVHRDFYDFQSYARVERWNGERWYEVDHLPHNKMEAVNSSESFSVAGFPDKDTLLDRAEVILRP
jgi:hypothetical protein